MDISKEMLGSKGRGCDKSKLHEMRKVNLTNGDTGVRSHTQSTESLPDHIKFDRCCLEQAGFTHTLLKAALQLRDLVLRFDDLLHLISQEKGSTALLLVSPKASDSYPKSLGFFYYTPD